MDRQTGVCCRDKEDRQAQRKLLCTFDHHTGLQNDLRRDCSFHRGDVSLGEGESKDLERDILEHLRASQPTVLGRQCNTVLPQLSHSGGDKVIAKAKPATLHLQIHPPQASRVSPSHSPPPGHSRNSHPRNLPGSTLVHLALSLTA